MLRAFVIQLIVLVGELQCPYYRGVCSNEVSARREFTIPNVFVGNIGSHEFYDIAYTTLKGVYVILTLRKGRPGSRACSHEKNHPSWLLLGLTRCDKQH